MIKIYLVRFKKIKKTSLLPLTKSYRRGALNISKVMNNAFLSKIFETHPTLSFK